MKIVGNKRRNFLINLGIFLFLGYFSVQDIYRAIEIHKAQYVAQYLPVQATTTIGEQVINLEVTRTIDERTKGLMYREALPDDRGMLFEFNPPDTLRFWMKNVPVPLDIVFIYQDKVVAIAPNVPPCKTDECPLYPENPVTADRVIELRSGLTKEIDLKLGERISIEKI
jgi:uncharacterized protein